MAAGIKGSTFVPEDPEELRRLVYEDRWTTVAIAEHYGISRDTLRRTLRKLGFTRDTEATWPGVGRKRSNPVASLHADTLGISQLRDALLRDIQKDKEPRGKRHAVKGTSDELHAAEVCLFDLHIGKYAWKAETGEDYDTDIAEQRARAAADDLLAQALPYRLEEIILPIGNDLLHYDNLQGTTTAGTIQDRDTRFHRMFRRANGLMYWLIKACAERANVRVIVVPGNHDTLSAWTLGQVLAARCESDPRISFDDSSRKRKYCLYGQNLIVYAHGHAEPHKKLPQIVAAEEPKLWAASTYREVHLGHFHKSKVTEPIFVDDHAGCTVRVLRSLSGTDNWHAEQGYVGNARGAEAFIWRKSGGLRANLFHQVQDKS